MSSSRLFCYAVLTCASSAAPTRNSMQKSAYRWTSRISKTKDRFKRQKTYSKRIWRKSSITSQVTSSFHTRLNLTIRRAKFQSIWSFRFKSRGATLPWLIRRSRGWTTSSSMIRIRRLLWQSRRAIRFWTASGRRKWWKFSITLKTKRRCVWMSKMKNKNWARNREIVNLTTNLA